MPNTLLLVDDDKQILETAQDILEAAGFVVRTADTGEAALKKLREGDSRVMIVDFNLPDTTGVELSLKAKKIRPEMVIILMSGEDNAELGSAKTIITTTLTKPVDPSTLIDIIRKIVDS